jgi:DNA-binding winged helix-turn-helix (wHTH) protein
MRFVFGDCELDTERYALHRAGQAVALEPKAFKVLTYLVQRHGRAVAKDEMCQAFWPGTSTDAYKEYALRNCLNKIRQVLGDAGMRGVVVETVRGYGYRFVAPVSTSPTLPRESDQPPPSQKDDYLTPPPAAQRHPLPGRRQLTLLYCGLVATSRLVRLDPDDFRSALQTFYTACERAIQPFDGYIAQYDSDGLLVYFGYPSAHEDAPQRAIRAGLRLVQQF